MTSRREFRNRLHEQLARRTARDAFRDAADDGNPIAVRCDPCETEFSAIREETLRDDLEAHYRTAEHRMATQLPIRKQRQGN